MGLDYTAIIYQKETDTWKEIYTRSINIFKGLPTEISTINHIIPESLKKEAGRYTDWEYIGLFEKENTNINLDLLPMSEVDNSREFENNCYCISDAPFTPRIFTKETYSNLKLDLSQFEVELLNSQELKNIETLQKENPHKKYISFDDFINKKLMKSNEYISLYAKVEHFYQGNFYNTGSFSNLRQEFEKKYESKLREFNKLEEIKNSIEYMKLSSEEKGNFLEEFEFKKDCLTEIKDVIDTCLYFENVLDFLSEFDYKDKEVVIFIYGTW